MDVKDLRTESALSEYNNDGSKYSHSGGIALHCERNKSYQDNGSNLLAKVDIQTTRPCAVIGPDRVVPPPVTSEAYLKKPSAEPWSCIDNAYHLRRPPEYPHKLPDFQNPTRNISPRQTFQENMQRIMVPPSYNSVKINDDSNFSQTTDRNNVLPKNIKLNVQPDGKFCDVPYPYYPISNEQKNIRNPDLCLSNVNPNITRSAPHGWPSGGVPVRPNRPYGAPEIYQYQDYPNCAGPRSLVSRPNRNIPEESGYVYAEPFYHQDGNIRFKPYPTVKERFPHQRYEYVSNYGNSFHPPPTFHSHKYDLQKPVAPHAFPPYPPIKYLDRAPETMIDGYQRAPQGGYNVPYHNQVIHPNYTPVLGNGPQNKMHSYPPDGHIKPPPPNKLSYENVKSYIDFENGRSKMQPPSENYLVNEMARMHSLKSQVIMPNYPTLNFHNIPQNTYYKKDNQHLKNCEYLPPHFRNIDPGLNIHNPIIRHGTVFSPTTLAMSPTDSSASNTSQTLGTQEDGGYVSQSSTVSVRSIDSGINRVPNEYFGKFYDSRFGPTIRTSSMISKSEPISSNNSKETKNLNVRQFLQMWNEGDEETEDSHPKDMITQTGPKNDKFRKTYEVTSQPNQEQLYVLGLVNVPSEELSKYEHIQKVSKLPENIKGYNHIELLNQFEEAIESSNMGNYKMSIPKDYQMPLKGVPIKRTANFMPPRSLSPLDVEAKISQSVIHKEVGCNFEIKPCSPKMLNVEVATPVQNILAERVIEKVANPIMLKSPRLNGMEDNIDCNMNRKENKLNINSEPVRIPSCKMINTQFSNHNSIDSIKNSYSLHDLESNSGLCLASLPRLDNDIELNFPEVNQQFINANKGDSTNSMISMKDLPALEELAQSHDQTQDENNDTHGLTQHDVTKSPCVMDYEKEISKLSKYRKTKIHMSDSKGNLTATRTDSVIIKNPDNFKNSEENVFSTNCLMHNADIQNTPINLTSQENIGENIDNPGNVVHDKEEKDMALDIAIDFSLSKASPNRECKKIDSLTSNSIKTDDPILKDSLTKIPMLDDCDQNIEYKKENTNPIVTPPLEDITSEKNYSSSSPIIKKTTDHSDCTSPIEINTVKTTSLLPMEFESSSPECIEISNDVKGFNVNNFENEDTQYDIDTHKDVIDNDNTNNQSCDATNKHSSEIRNTKDVIESSFNIFESNYNEVKHREQIKLTEDLQNINCSNANITDKENLEDKSHNSDGIFKQIELKTEPSFNNIISINKSETTHNPYEKSENILRTTDISFGTVPADILLNNVGNCRTDNDLRQSCVHSDLLSAKDAPKQEESMTSDKIAICKPNHDQIKNNLGKNYSNSDAHSPDDIEMYSYDGKNTREETDSKFLPKDSPPRANEKNDSNSNCNVTTSNKTDYSSENIAVNNSEELLKIVTNLEENSSYTEKKDYEDIFSQNFNDPPQITTFVKHKTQFRRLRYLHGSKRMHSPLIQDLLLFCEGNINTMKTCNNYSRALTDMKTVRKLEMSAHCKNGVNDHSDKITDCVKNNMFPRIESKAIEMSEHTNSLDITSNSRFPLQELDEKQEIMAGDFRFCNKNTLCNEEVNEYYFPQSAITNTKEIKSILTPTSASIADEPTNSMTNNCDSLNTSSTLSKVVQKKLVDSNDLKMEMCQFVDDIPEGPDIQSYCSDNTEELEIKFNSSYKWSEKETKSKHETCEKTCEDSSYYEETLQQTNKSSNFVNKTDESATNPLMINNKIAEREQIFPYTDDICQRDRVIQQSNFMDPLDEKYQKVKDSIFDENVERDQVDSLSTQDHSSQRDQMDKKSNISDDITKSDKESPYFQELLQQDLVCKQSNFSDDIAKEVRVHLKSPCAKEVVQKDQVNIPSQLSYETAQRNRVDEDLLCTQENIKQDQVDIQINLSAKTADRDCADSSYPQKNIEREQVNKKIGFVDDIAGRDQLNEDLSWREPQVNIQQSRVDNHVSLIDDRTIDKDLSSTSEVLRDSMDKQFNSINEIIDPRDRCSKGVFNSNTTKNSGELSNCNVGIVEHWDKQDEMSKREDQNNKNVSEQLEKHSICHVESSDQGETDKLSNYSKGDSDYWDKKSNYNNDMLQQCQHKRSYNGFEISEQCIDKDKPHSTSLENRNLTFSSAEHNFDNRERQPLKRSLSDSALNVFSNKKENEENISVMWPFKRRKPNNIGNNLLAQDLCSIIQSNRRNSVSSFYNEENVSFCILIDDSCIIAEEENDEQEKICYTELPDECLAEIQKDYMIQDKNNTVSQVITASQQETIFAYSDSYIMDEDDKLSESWVEDVGCVETIISDDIAENVEICEPSSPKCDVLSESDESEVFRSNDHTDKVKYIYGEKMCNDDAQFVETLYNTPQMDVNRTLSRRESLISCDYYDNDSLEKILSGSNEKELPPYAYEDTDSALSTAVVQELLEARENKIEKPWQAQEVALDIEDVTINRINMKNATLRDETTANDEFTRNENDDNTNDITSSSPEVTSTTSEEKNSTILLKITNYKGSRVSQFNEINSEVKRSSCKFTEDKDYIQSHVNFSKHRPLLTKGAQKYIPPLKETVRDLKVKLTLPPHSLMKLKQLKKSKEEPKVFKENISDPRSSKKPKLKFEDVLKSIDEIQFKMHKEKAKKSKKSIPKVVIKKTENGSHYASTSRKDNFNPDLTGRKWQPWVFIEKNHFIDKMALKRKTKAIYNHRKRTYVLAEKFQKYKSVNHAKFVITPPISDCPSTGLKYTIRLTHNY